MQNITTKLATEIVDRTFALPARKDESSLRDGDVRNEIVSIEECAIEMQWNLTPAQSKHFVKVLRAHAERYQWAYGIIGEIHAQDTAERLERFADTVAYQWHH